MDAPPRQFTERIRAADAGRPLRIRGGGSKDFYGQALIGDVLDVSGYAGVVAYEPAELVVTARCGTPLAELDAALDRHHQWLPFEPPSFGAAATVGGMVAAGLSGPGRAASGSVRDFVLGARVMNASAEVLSFGGQVMKNVAGYDVSRLLAGSLGTLGLILEVSLKVLPRPGSTATLRLELPSGRAIELLNQWSGRPLPITASAYANGELSVRLAGSAAAIDGARARIGGDELPAEQAAQFWRGIREQTDPFFQGDLPLWRLSVPSRTPPLELSGPQLIEWNGALRWLSSGAAAPVIRAAAAACGGHATLFRGGDKATGVFQPLTPVLLKLHRQLKRELDPLGIFNRGRMYPEW